MHPADRLRKAYEANPEPVERLAKARQAMAPTELPSWDMLDEHERDAARQDARQWLIAAHLAELIPSEDVWDVGSHE